MTSYYYGTNAGGGGGGMGPPGPPGPQGDPGPGSALVFRPGLPSSDNFYATWAELIAAKVGPSDIVFDDTNGACVIPAGTYDMNYCRWVGNLGSNALVAVELSEGVVINGLGNITNRLNITFSGTSPVFTYSAADQKVLFMDAGSRFTTSGAGPVIYVTDAGTNLTLVLERGATLENGSYEIVELASGGQVTLIGFEIAMLENDTIRGVVGTTLVRVYGSAGASLATTQTNFAGTDVTVFFDQLSNIDGTITATQHGAQSDPTNHAVATTIDAGFMSAADKVKVDAIATHAYTAGETINSGAVVSIEDVAGTPKVFAALSSDGAGSGPKADPIGLIMMSAVADDLVTVSSAGQVIDVPDLQWDAVPATTDVGARVYLDDSAGGMTLTAPGAGNNNISVGRVVRGGTGAVQVLVLIGEGAII